MWLTCSQRCVKPLGQERIRGWNRLSHEKFVERVVRVLEGEKEKEAAAEAQNWSVASIAGLARRLGMKEEHVALAFSAVEESSHPKYRRMFAALPVPEDMLSAGCRVRHPVGLSEIPGIGDDLCPRHRRSRASRSCQRSAGRGCRLRDSSTSRFASSRRWTASRSMGVYVSRR